MLRGTWLSVQAKSSGSIADDENFREQSALDVVAGGALGIKFMNWRDLETFSFGDNPVLADQLLCARP
jgi:hypothetical protein